MRKLICIVVIAILMTSLFPVSILAENSSWTIDEIQDMAEENNIQASIDDLDIRNKENALKKAQEDARNLSDAYGTANVFSNWTTREVKPLEAALSLEVSKKTKQDHLVITRQDSYRQALKILLLAKQYMYENQKLQIYIERVNMAKTRYASRNITEDDLAEAEYKVESKKLDLTNISQRTEAAGMELNKMLGRPLTASAIAVKDELTMEEFHTPDLDKLVSVSLEINTGVYTKDGELKAAQKLMELTEKLYKKGDLTYDINYYSLEAAKADLADVKRNLETQIRNKYNDLLTSKGKVEISQKYLQLLQKKLSAIDTKFKKGVESKDNLLSVKEQYIDAQYSYWSAVSDYDLALREFNDLLK